MGRKHSGNKAGVKRMISPQLFPFTLAFLDLCAAVVYLAHADYRHTVYWLAAMTLTITVTLK